MRVYQHPADVCSLVPGKEILQLAFNPHNRLLTHTFSQASREQTPVHLLHSAPCDFPFPLRLAWWLLEICFLSAGRHCVWRGVLLAVPSQISNLAFDWPLFDLGSFIFISLFLPVA